MRLAAEPARLVARNPRRVLAHLVVLAARHLVVEERLEQARVQVELARGQPYSDSRAPARVLEVLERQVCSELPKPVPRLVLDVSVVPHPLFVRTQLMEVATQIENVPPVTTGTANPAFTAHTEKDPSGSANLQYQSITCMPVYRGTSFEVRSLKSVSECSR